MKIYKAFDLDNVLIYIGKPVDIDITPDKNGDLLIPYNMSEHAPPERTNKNQVQVLYQNPKRWALVDDFRGQSYWDKDGAFHVINKVGRKVPAGCLCEPPPSEYHASHDGISWLIDEDKFSSELATSYMNAKKAIDEKADSMISMGFTSSALGSIHEYDCRFVDQLNLPRGISCSLSTGSPVLYLAKPEGGYFSEIPHSHKQLLSVQVDMDSHIESNRLIAREKKRELDYLFDALDIEGIKSYNIEDWSV